MSGTRGLLDSNILIYLSNKQLDPKILFERYKELLISRITHIEVLGYDFLDKNDEDLVKKLVLQFPILELDKLVGEATIELRKKEKLSFLTQLFIQLHWYMNVS